MSSGIDLLGRAARLLALALACTLLSRTPATAQNLTIAAASDLQSVLPAIAAQFEKDTGQKVTLTFGSSGNFYTQIPARRALRRLHVRGHRLPTAPRAVGAGRRGSLVEYAMGTSSCGRGRIPASIFAAACRCSASSPIRR
jgi:molybdate transport system substrate-binding protein